MIYRNLYLNVLIRVILLSLTFLALAFAVYKWKDPVILVNLAVAGILNIARLKPLSASQTARRDRGIPAMPARLAMRRGRLAAKHRYTNTSPPGSPPKVLARRRSNFRFYSCAAERNGRGKGSNGPDGNSQTPATKMLHLLHDHGSFFVSRSVRLRPGSQNHAHSV